MIIGTFNTDNTDPSKAVPTLETKWVPDWGGNKEAPEEEQAYIKGRYLIPGEVIKYQPFDRNLVANPSEWKYTQLFRDTVDEVHGFYWEDARTGEKHELDKESILKLPVTTKTERIGDTIVFGWFNHIMAGESLTEDEVKNSSSASKRSD